MPRDSRIRACLVINSQFVTASSHRQKKKSARRTTASKLDKCLHVLSVFLFRKLIKGLIIRYLLLDPGFLVSWHKRAKFDANWSTCFRDLTEHTRTQTHAFPIFQIYIEAV